MKSICQLSLLFLGITVLFTNCALVGILPKTESERFDKLVTDYFNGKIVPSSRSQEGIARLSARVDTLNASSTKMALQRLRSIDTTRLTLDERIDWLQLEAVMKRSTRDLNLNSAARIPSRYITTGNLYWQITGERKLSEKEWQEIGKTLREVPSVVALGKRQLQEPPPLWIRLAVNTLIRNEDFLTGVFQEKVRESAPSDQKEALITAVRTAKDVLAEFRFFLNDSLKKGGESSWAAGTKYYDWLLKEVHFLPHTAEEMIAIGWRIHQKTKDDLAELAKRIDPSKSVAQLIEEMKSRHPDQGKITEAYQRESNRARELLISRDLISIPEPETLLFVPTPPALRETYAWAGYGGIQMKDGMPMGRFFVTDVALEMTEVEVREKLRAQNNGWVTVIALHEGYPGHHLQSLYTRKNLSKVRSRFGNTYYGEGWALYCEAWMAREGFFRTADDSLAWLQMRLWRTARVIVDPSLHIGRMTYEQAVEFMVHEVGLERSAAEAEVNRYTTWPTQAPSYIIGWLEIEELQRQIEEKMGVRFDQRRFVETILEVGPLPLELMKRAVLHRYGSLQKYLPID